MTQENIPVWNDERLNSLAELVAQNTQGIKELREETKELTQSIKDLREESKDLSQSIKDLREESKEQNIKFAAYQQASQWVVNLAFSLIAGATVITVASAIFKR
jgi:uncharacterized coiled-coil DUF342 family protein